MPGTAKIKGLNLTRPPVFFIQTRNNPFTNKFLAH